MTELEALGARIEATYRTIAETRMAGIALVHPELGVAMRGLRRYGDNHVGILVTPWFMNVVFVPLAQPGEQGCEAVPKIGSKRGFILPSGFYEAIAGYEEGIGWHWSCSLFSPMFEFAQMECALETADASLDLLFTAPDGSGQGEDEEAVRARNSEDFRAAMVQPKGAGGVDERVRAMAAHEAEEAALREVAAQEAPIPADPQPQPREPAPSGGVDRRALFGLRRREGAGQ